MLGSNFDGPNPYQTGTFGVIVWVRSMYLAPFRCWSYTAHRPVSSAAPATDAQPIPRVSMRPARTARRRGFNADENSPTMRRSAVQRWLIGFMVLCPFGKAWTIDGISYLNGGSSRDWECQLEQAMTLVIVTPVRHAFWPSIISSFYTTAKVSVNTRDCCSNSANHSTIG